MRLHFESIGSGFPVIILHGLFGSSDNWLGFARKLGGQFRVILPDLRNHGKSPHDPDMTYPLLASDIRELLDAEGLQRAHVMGHSMGGKAAMQLALCFSDRVRSLVVVDIAPKSYRPVHSGILYGLVDLDLARFNSRHEIEDALKDSIPDLAARRFLLKSVARNPHAGFHWQMGIREIANNYENMGEGIISETGFAGPSLFLRGELSNYLDESDETAIRRMFPNAEFRQIEGASHWVHTDNPSAFWAAVSEFLSRS